MKLLTFNEFNNYELNEGLLGELLDLVSLNRKRRKLKKLIDQQEQEDQKEDLKVKFLELKRQEALKRKRVSELESEYETKVKAAQSNMNSE